jgi:hypothetical protein
MEGLQGYRSDSSDDAAPAAPAAPAMEVEMVTMVDMGRVASRADGPLQQDEARQRTLRRKRAQGRAWGGRLKKKMHFKPAFFYKTLFFW